MIVWNINCKEYNLFQGNADNLWNMCPPNLTLLLLLIRNIIILMTLKLKHHNAQDFIHNPCHMLRVARYENSCEPSLLFADRKNIKTANQP